MCLFVHINTGVADIGPVVSGSARGRARREEQHVPPHCARRMTSAQRSVPVFVSESRTVPNPMLVPDATCSLCKQQRYCCGQGSHVFISRPVSFLSRGSNPASMCANVGCMVRARILDLTQAVLHHRKLVLLLDYDGTLTPIVKDPSKALLSERVSRREQPQQQ